MEEKGCYHILPQLVDLNLKTSLYRDDGLAVANKIKRQKKVKKADMLNF